MTLLSAIVEFLLLAIAAGLVASLAMMGVMSSITKLKLANADMIRAIGSLFTKKLESAWSVGTMLHLTAGIAFAVIYLLVFQLVGMTGEFAILGGLLLGFGHGFVMSFILVASIAEHHPLPQFQNGTLGVAFSHIVGHCVYGLVVGAIVAVSGMSFASFEKEIVANSLGTNEKMAEYVVAEGIVECPGFENTSVVRASAKFPE